MLHNLQNTTPVYLPDVLIMQKFILSTREYLISLSPLLLVFYHSIGLGEYMCAKRTLIIKVSLPHLLLMLLEIPILNHVLVIYCLYMNLMSSLAHTVFVVLERFIVFGKNSRFTNMVVNTISQQQHLSHLK
jgi:hypothetical protein